MERAAWAALAAIPQVGGKTITRLLRQFGSLDAVLTASPGALAQVPGVGQRTAHAISSLDLSAAQARLEQYTAQGIEIATWEDANYPSNLMKAGDAPPVLFVRGTLEAEDARAAAIVGTRQPSPESAQLAEQLAEELSARGWVIVSGLALGIDAAAHRGALAAGRGRTLAVLGSGVRRITPRSNRALGERIIESGALLSEVAPDSGITRQGLIARNRITSGLSRAVIVVQSSTDSGSVNTAKRALAQGRAVFAITNGRGEGDHLLALGAEPLPAGEIDPDALSRRLDTLEITSPPDDDQPVQKQLF